jgi:glucose-6-phosphate 1-dehydrogenase
MKTHKILILGITGNLSKLKILPAIGQYFDIYKDDYNIELYGYSRSTANEEEIKTLIRSQTTSDLNSLKICLETGQYTDITFYDKLVSSLGEGDKLTVYLAVPPSVYLGFLDSSCPYSSTAIDILIEKPFGENLEEAKSLLETIEKCQLNRNVHFIDHYLFKDSLQLDILDVQQQLSYYSLSFNNVKEINIIALETVGVMDRGGYYDTIGALKDMFPHLLSLFNFGLEFFGKPSFEENMWSIKSKEFSQYQGYQNDVGNLQSQTQSYFKINLELINMKNEVVKVIMESGKKLTQKLTQLEIKFDNGHCLNLQLAPEKTLKLTDKNNIVLNNFGVHIENKIDHVRVFDDIFVEDYSRFVPNSKVLEYWKLYNKIVNS